VPGSPSGLTLGMRTRAWVSSTTFVSMALLSLAMPGFQA